MDRIIIGLLIIIFIQFIYWMYNEKKIANELVKGFWVAPPDFLAEAGLRSMLLYIGEKSFGGKNRGYILIQGDGDELIANSPVDISISIGMGMPYYKNKSKGKIIFCDVEENSKFPLKQNIELNLGIGKMILSRGDTIYGVMYRSPELTEKLFIGG